MAEIKLYSSVSEAVKDIFGEERYVVKKSYVSGGDINEARALLLDDGTKLFMKSNSAASLENFKAEAAGLDEIRAADAIGVPDVLGTGTDSGFSCSFRLSEAVSEFGITGRRLQLNWQLCTELMYVRTENTDLPGTTGLVPGNR